MYAIRSYYGCSFAAASSRTAPATRSWSRRLIPTRAHSSRMAKVSGTNAPDAGAVFIIPLFFAESTRNNFV